MNTIIERINYLEGLSEDFDFMFYINLYKDLIKAGINTKIEAQKHYLTLGIKEGRLKSTRDFYRLFPNFNWKYYTSIYPDVESFNLYGKIIKNSSEIKAIVHFYNIGRFQMRSYQNPDEPSIVQTEDLMDIIKNMSEQISNLQNEIKTIKSLK